MAYIATIQENAFRIKVEESAAHGFRVTVGEKEYEIDFLEPQKNIFSLIIAGRSYEVDVDSIEKSDRFGVGVRGEHYDIEVIDEKKKLSQKAARGASGRQDIKSPMAGNVRSVLVKAGDQVTAGQVLIILEAMKMQNEIASPIEGMVSSVAARDGVPVAAGDPLCVVEPSVKEAP